MKGAVVIALSIGLASPAMAQPHYLPEPQAVNAETMAAINAAGRYRTIRYAPACIPDMAIEDRRRLNVLLRTVEDQFLPQATAEQRMAYVALTREIDADIIEARRWDGTGNGPAKAGGALAFLCRRVSADLTALLLQEPRR